MKRINHVKFNPLRAAKNLDLARLRQRIELKRLETELLNLKKEQHSMSDLKMWLGYMRCCVRQRPDFLSKFEQEIVLNIPEEWEPNLTL